MLPAECGGPLPPRQTERSWLPPLIMVAFTLPPIPARPGFQIMCPWGFGTLLPPRRTEPCCTRQTTLSAFQAPGESTGQPMAVPCGHRLPRLHTCRLGTRLRVPATGLKSWQPEPTKELQTKSIFQPTRETFGPRQRLPLSPTPSGMQLPAPENQGHSFVVINAGGISASAEFKSDISRLDLGNEPGITHKWPE